MADSTLSVLLPGVPEMVAGERVEIRPVILEELRLVERVMEGWSVLVQSNGATILPEAWDAFLTLLSGAAGLSIATIKDLGPADLEHLVCLVLAINKDIWDPPPAEPDVEPYTWAQIVQRLVQAGHTRSSIMGMTLAQVQAFLREAMRHERETLALDITAASFAMADGATVQRVTKELRRG